MPYFNFLAFIDSEISAFIRTDGQKDTARSTRLVILIKNIHMYIYVTKDKELILLPATYILSVEYNIPFYSTSNGYTKCKIVVKNVLILIFYPNMAVSRKAYTLETKTVFCAQGQKTPYFFLSELQTSRAQFIHMQPLCEGDQFNRAPPSVPSMRSA